MPRRFTCERHTPKGRASCAKATKKGLGYVEWDAPSASATLLVGRTRGTRPGNRTGACAKAPRETPLERPEDAVFEMRSKQVGAKNAGLTRMKARGIYQGAKENTVAIQIFPSELDGSWRGFKKNIAKIAETLTAGTCQDEVLVVFDDGDRKHTYSHAWTDEDGTVFKPAGNKRLIKKLRKP